MSVRVVSEGMCYVEGEGNLLNSDLVKGKQYKF